MTVTFDPPAEVCELLAQMPSATDFQVTRICRALRPIVRAAQEWLRLESENSGVGNPMLEMGVDDLELSTEEREWLMAQLPKGYWAEVRGGGSFVIFAP